MAGTTTTRPVEANTTRPPAHLLAPVADWRFLVALALLVVNDQVLKSAYGNWFTGKLSDVAGLVVLPVLAAAALRAAGIRHAVPVAFAGVAGWFAAMKTSPSVASGTERLAELVTGVSSSIVVDPTDLIGLAALPIAAAILREPIPLITSRTLKCAVFAVGLLACTATSNDDTGTPQDLTVDAQTGEVGWVAPESAFFDESIDGIDGDDDGASGTDSTGRSPDLLGEGEFATKACLSNDGSASGGGDCFRIDGGRIERQNEAGNWDLEWALFDTPSVFRAVGGGGGYDPSLKAVDIATSHDGEVVVAFDGVNPVRRDTSGSWSPAASEYRPIAGLVAMILLGGGGLVLAALSRRAGAALTVALMLLGATWVSMSTGDLFTGLLVLAGVFLAAVGAIIGLALIPKIKRPLNKPQAALAVGAVVTSVAMLLIWKYLVSAPVWFIGVAPVVAAAGVMASLAVPARVPPPPTQASVSAAAS